LLSNAVRAYYRGARKALRDVVSLMKSTALPGFLVGAVYGVYRYAITQEVDVVMPLLLYTAVTVTLQPISIYYKIVEFVGEAHSLQSSGERLGYIKPKCVNLEVVNHRDVGSTRYIEVRCRLGYMTSHGCPASCPGYRGSASSGAATFAGTVLGGLIGLVGGSLGVLAGAIIGGLLGAAYEVAGSLTQFEQLVDEARSRGLRIVVKPIR